MVFLDPPAPGDDFAVICENYRFVRRFSLVCRRWRKLGLGGVMTTAVRLILIFLLSRAGVHTAMAAGFNPELDAEAVAARKAEDVNPADIFKWEALSASDGQDGDVLVSLRLSAQPGWSIYVENFSVLAPAGYRLGKVEMPQAKRQLDPISGKEVDVLEGGDFVVQLLGPSWDKPNFALAVRYVGCTQVICLFPYTQTLSAPWIKPEPKVPATTVLAGSLGSNASAEASPELDLESRLAHALKGGSLGPAVLLLVIFVGGILSNLTPCVYPMIPITLRLLSRQGASPYRSAFTYALGIVITYSSLGVAAAFSGAMFGGLLASKGFNLTFAAIMLALSLSMLGFGNFARLQALGSKLGSGKPSFANTLAMGVGAGLVAAPCTGPILAALLAHAARAEQGPAWSILTLVVYSTGFALPYVLLGGAAAKVNRIKIGPSWQVAVKFIFAAVMMALAFYYLRIPLYDQLKAGKPYWGLAAALGSSLGMALVAAFVIFDRLGQNKLAGVLPTLILGFGIFSLSQWLTGNTGGEQHVAWIKDEKAALELAAKTNKPVIIDMWAEWCEACKKLDVTTFRDALVIRELDSGWIALKLDLTEETPATLDIQKRYGITSLPTLVLLPANADLTKKRPIAGFINADGLLGELKAFSKEVR